MKKCKTCGIKFKPRFSSLEKHCSYKCSQDDKTTITAKNMVRLRTPKANKKEISGYAKRHSVINKKSTKQARIDSQLAKIKAKKIERLGDICECCQEQRMDDISHFIPGSKGRPYYLDPNASCLSCRTCHVVYEDLKYEHIIKFKNLRTILEYLKTRSYGRYLKISSFL